LGGSAPPIPNCFGLFSNSGFVTTCTDQTALGNQTKNEQTSQEQALQSARISSLPASSWREPAPCLLSSGPARFYNSWRTISIKIHGSQLRIFTRRQQIPLLITHSKGVATRAGKGNQAREREARTILPAAAAS
jgi:hypothetical protein